MVPLRSATTLFGTPALISDCAPMMLRVRPAQLTTTERAGRRREVADAQHQLRARHVDPSRDRDALVFVERAAVEHHHVGAGAEQPIELIGRDARRAVRMLDELAERLARHIDAREQLEARRGPGGNATPQRETVGVAGTNRICGRALGEAVAVVAQHDARTASRDEAANSSSSRLNGTERANRR